MFQSKVQYNYRRSEKRRILEKQEHYHWTNMRLLQVIRINLYKQ